MVDLTGMTMDELQRMMIHLRSDHIQHNRDSENHHLKGNVIKQIQAELASENVVSQMHEIRKNIVARLTSGVTA